ncbi:MAG: FAD-dependent oxidoreductase [Synergistaceae bacterium]|jgi:NADPH-dependent 2,4-dienoyl-CoA reductase/sulfur reductase-like enzyme|nr:FAD-dependent oxidoreductase [Synergistaceae bacterium]
MKVVVIGCTHAGTAAVVNIAALYRDAKVTVYERNDNISFLSCGIALNVEGIVKDPATLFYSSPEKLAELGVETRMKHDVVSVNVADKKLRVRNVETGQEFDDTYDKLVVTSGSWPVEPKIENSGLDNILLCKNYGHAQEIIRRTKTAQRIAIVGAGYIGTELAEAFEVQGKSVVLIDQAPQILAKYLDPEMVACPQQLYLDRGIELAFNQTVEAFVDDGRGGVAAVKTDGGEYKADMVVLCVGFRPNTAIFRGQLDMTPNGAIRVDEYMRTSAPDVLAAGDCCAVHNNASGRPEYIPLATNAVRMGTLVARNLKNPTTKHPGAQGTSGIKIYDWNIASTGLTEIVAREMGLDAASSTLRDNYRPEFMPTTSELLLRIVYERGSGRLLGAQLQSKADLTQSINALSVCIQQRMTVEELAFTDFFFQPHYNKPWNFLNSVALKVLPPL